MEPHLLDIVDDEWMMDTLPNDAITLPSGVQLVDDQDDTHATQQPSQPDKWQEMMLH